VDPTLVKSFYDCSREVGSDAVLMVFLGGNSAQQIMSAMSEEEAVQDTMAALRKAFDNVPDPAATKVTRWMQDPWACGSYSFAKVGSTADGE
jgi:polyamine oxidase